MDASKFNFEKEIANTQVRLCLDCGKCTVVCPVAQHEPRFNPRLVAQGALEGAGQGRDDTIWSCLSCYMCVERCNYRVKFPEFIQALRTKAVVEGARVECSHSGMLQTLMHLMTREGLQQDRLGWLPDDIALSAESSTIFFVGCAPYFDVVFRDLGVATLEGAKGALRLLNRAKVPIDILANEHCCGRDLLLQGDRKGFQALAQANLEEFRRRGAKKIITYCPECYYTLGVDYPRVVGGTGIEVVHLTQVLAPLVRSGELRLGKLGEKVTYHDPCTLGRCSRIFDEPRLILSSVAGLDLVEMEQSREKALCCGATPWVRCGAVNQQIQKRRLEQANSTGAAMLVTACPKCEIHLKCACKTSGGNAGDIMIKDFASLVAQSSGLGGQSVG